MSKDKIELPKEGEQLTHAQINILRKQAEGRSAEQSASGTAKPSEGLSAAELKAALDAKGIDYKASASKADLAAQLDEAV